MVPQNKVDLVTEAAALNQHETIQRFIQVCRSGGGRAPGQWNRAQQCRGVVLISWQAVGQHVALLVLVPHPPATLAASLQGTIAEGAPVVPISAQLKYNVDAVRARLHTSTRLHEWRNVAARAVACIGCHLPAACCPRHTAANSPPTFPLCPPPQVCEYLVKKIPVPVRDFTSPPQVGLGLGGGKVSGCLAAAPVACGPLPAWQEVDARCSVPALSNPPTTNDMPTRP